MDSKVLACPAFLILLSNHMDFRSPIQSFVLIHPLNSTFYSNNSFYYIPFYFSAHSCDVVVFSLLLLLPNSLYIVCTCTT